MVMIDMFKNAKEHNLSFDDILKRHVALGSPDFSKIKPGRVENSSERYEFLQKLYNFVMANDGLEAGVSYSQWIQQNS
jgi:hypothetical protein